MRYVALLRAVNVGGRKVQMAPLRAAVEALGFERVVQLRKGRWPNENWPEQVLGTSTARFWHTTAKILEAAKKGA